MWRVVIIYYNWNSFLVIIKYLLFGVDRLIVLFFLVGFLVVRVGGMYYLFACCMLFLSEREEERVVEVIKFSLDCGWREFSF